VFALRIGFCLPELKELAMQNSRLFNNFENNYVLWKNGFKKYP